MLNIHNFPIGRDAVRAIRRIVDFLGPILILFGMLLVGIFLEIIMTAFRIEEEDD